jgi:hypothetical protein
MTGSTPREIQIGHFSPHCEILIWLLRHWKIAPGWGFRIFGTHNAICIIFDTPEAGGKQFVPLGLSSFAWWPRKCCKWLVQVNRFALAASPQPGAGVTTINEAEQEVAAYKHESLATTWKSCPGIKIRQSPRQKSETLKQNPVKRDREDWPTCRRLARSWRETRLPHTVSPKRLSKSIWNRCLDRTIFNSM